jgi:hypothetical protein
MTPTRPARLVLLLLSLGLLGTPVVTAQVATLGTPPPAEAPSEVPLEEVDGEEAILDFVACLREQGLDLPDPQFGPDGPRFPDPSVLLRIDFRSAEFLDAMEACSELLAALQPEIDPAQQAEQVEQQLAFAECLRREGIDFPDPDPLRGFTISTLRGPDGELAIDPFSPEFRAAASVCASEIGFGPPGAPSAAP